MKKYLLISISIILILPLFSGCGAILPAPSASTTVSVIETPAVTPLPTQAHTPFPSPSSTPTPSATDSPSPAATIDQETKTVVDNEIQDFLIKTGDYTEEKMKPKMILMDKGKKTKLGILNSDFYVEGWLFDCKNLGDYVVMAMGFDGKDGNRFVTEVAIPIYVYEKGNLNGLNKYSIDRTINESIVTGWKPDSSFKNGEELTARLEELKNGPLVFGVSRRKNTESTEGLNDAVVRYKNEINSKVDLGNKLYSEVSNNGLNLDIPSVSDGVSLVKITKIEDVDNIEINNIPILADQIIYY